MRIMTGKVNKLTVYDRRFDNVGYLSKLAHYFINV